MDPLVLVRVASVLGETLAGTVLVRVHDDAPDRLRLIFEAEDRRIQVAVSTRPDLPWIGRPGDRRDLPRRAPAPFVARAHHALSGRRVARLEKPGPDRVLLLEMAGGGGLAIELTPHASNVALLGARHEVLATARRPRGGHARLAEGEVYSLPPMPGGKLVPYGLAPDAIDAFLAEAGDSGLDRLDALRRRVFGVGNEAARLVVEEARATGVTPGKALAARLEGLSAGTLDPVIEGPPGLLEEARRGTLDVARLRLLPWPPLSPPDGVRLVALADAASTAGLFHDAFDLARRLASRIDGLRAILRGEIRRVFEAERRAAADLEGFADPDRYRVYGEALLAGLHAARRSGDHVLVPDPYDAGGRELAIPCRPDLGLKAAAEEYFHRCRRARRGQAAARARRESLGARLGRLETLLEAAEGARGEEAGDRLEEAMRGEGIPVGLAARSRAAGAAARAAAPRGEGVRLLTSSDGLTILVGRSGRDNDRLTCRLASPEDFWFHASGTPGAHVVVRNPGKRPRPPEATLIEAAAAAAWFSDAKRETQAEVQWTRTKYVRRVRGASPGTVALKRFETVRVRPVLPSGSEGEP